MLNTHNSGHLKASTWENKAQTVNYHTAGGQWPISIIKMPNIQVQVGETWSRRG